MSFNMLLDVDGLVSTESRNLNEFQSGRVNMAADLSTESRNLNEFQ